MDPFLFPSKAATLWTNHDNNNYYYVCKGQSASKFTKCINASYTNLQHKLSLCLKDIYRHSTKSHDIQIFLVRGSNRQSVGKVGNLDWSCYLIQPIPFNFQTFKPPYWWNLKHKFNPVCPVTYFYAWQSHMKGFYCGLLTRTNCTPGYWSIFSKKIGLSDWPKEPP